MKMVKNAINREVPTYIEGLGELTPYQGVWEYIKKNPYSRIPTSSGNVMPGDTKILSSLEEAIEKSGLKNGMTVSFHHHFRSGDETLVQVIEAIDKMGIKDITVFSSSLTSPHNALVDYIRKGTIRRIFTSGIRDKLGKAISKGELSVPVVIRSHGGRARAIENGDAKIDVAFLAAPSVDYYGNITGTKGPSACGALGYAMMDAMYAKTVVAVTDNLVDYPVKPISIPQINVDYIVQVDRIGNPQKIGTGTTRMTRNPLDLLIAKYAADVIINSPYFKEGFSFQTGAGGASLAVAKYVREEMLKRNIKGSFGIGGITSYMVKMLEDGLFHTLFDVQSFDMEAVRSIRENPDHVEISASYYASPANKGAVINNLDIVILGAFEVDVDFNVNVITNNFGYIQGASGGHSDTAAASKLSIVVVPSFRGRIPSIKDKVQTVITPGDTVDVIVTERGIAVNPKRKDLMDELKGTKLPIKDIHQIKEEVEKITGKPEPLKFTDRIVGVVEYRDGTILDVIYEVDE